MLFICLSADGHLGFLYFFPIMINAAMHIHIHEYAMHIHIQRKKKQLTFFFRAV